MGSRESRSAVNSAPAVAGAFYCRLRSRGFEQVRELLQPAAKERIAEAGRSAAPGRPAEKASADLRDLSPAPAAQQTTPPAGCGLPAATATQNAGSATARADGVCRPSRPPSPESA